MSTEFPEVRRLVDSLSRLLKSPTLTLTPSPAEVREIPSYANSANSNSYSNSNSHTASMSASGNIATVKEVTAASGTPVRQWQQGKGLVLAASAITTTNTNTKTTTGGATGSVSTSGSGSWSSSGSGSETAASRFQSTPSTQQQYQSQSQSQYAQGGNNVRMSPSEDSTYAQRAQNTIERGIYSIISCLYLHASLVSMPLLYVFICIFLVTFYLYFCSVLGRVDKLNRMLREVPKPEKIGMALFGLQVTHTQEYSTR